MKIKRRSFLKTATSSAIGMLAAPQVVSGIFMNDGSDAVEIEKVLVIFKLIWM